MLLCCNAELFELLTRAIQIDEAVAGWTLKKNKSILCAELPIIIITALGRN